MVANKRIDIRVTKRQFERAKFLAESNGFETVSDYIRNTAIKEDCDIDFRRTVSKRLDERRQDDGIIATSEV